MHLLNFTRWIFLVLSLCLVLHASDTKTLVLVTNYACTDNGTACASRLILEFGSVFTQNYIDYFDNDRVACEYSNVSLEIRCEWIDIPSLETCATNFRIFLRLSLGNPTIPIFEDRLVGGRSSQTCYTSSVLEDLEYVEEDYTSSEWRVQVLDPRACADFEDIFWQRDEMCCSEVAECEVGSGVCQQDDDCDAIDFEPTSESEAARVGYCAGAGSCRHFWNSDDWTSEDRCCLDLAQCAVVGASGWFPAESCCGENDVSCQKHEGGCTNDAGCINELICGENNCAELWEPQLGEYSEEYNYGCCVDMKTDVVLSTNAMLPDISSPFTGSATYTIQLGKSTNTPPLSPPRSLFIEDFTQVGATMEATSWNIDGLYEIFDSWTLCATDDFDSPPPLICVDSITVSTGPSNPRVLTWDAASDRIDESDVKGQCVFLGSPDTLNGISPRTGYRYESCITWNNIDDCSSDPSPCTTYQNCERFLEGSTCHAPTATAAPTPIPTSEPTPTPTELPTPMPTEEPTPMPTAEPTPMPTEEPTPMPTAEPTPMPTAEPTPVPTSVTTATLPTPIDTPAVSTAVPTPAPAPDSTPAPTDGPTDLPTPATNPILPDSTPAPTPESGTSSAGGGESGLSSSTVAAVVSVMCLLFVCAAAGIYWRFATWKRKQGSAVPTGFFISGLSGRGRDEVVDVDGMSKTVSMVMSKDGEYIFHPAAYDGFSPPSPTGGAGGRSAENTPLKKSPTRSDRKQQSEEEIETMVTYNSATSSPRRRGKEQSKERQATRKLEYEEHVDPFVRPNAAAAAADKHSSYDSRHTPQYVEVTELKRGGHSRTPSRSEEISPKAANRRSLLQQPGSRKSSSGHNRMLSSPLSPTAGRLLAAEASGGRRHAGHSRAKSSSDMPSKGGENPEFAIGDHIAVSGDVLPPRPDIEAPVEPPATATIKVDAPRPDILPPPVPAEFDTVPADEHKHDTVPDDTVPAPMIMPPPPPEDEDDEDDDDDDDSGRYSPIVKYEDDEPSRSRYGNSILAPSVKYTERTNEVAVAYGNSGDEGSEMLSESELTDISDTEYEREVRRRNSKLKRSRRSGGKSARSHSHMFDYVPSQDDGGPPKR